MRVDVDEPWMTLVSPLGRIYLFATRFSRHRFVPDPAHASLSSAERIRAERLQGIPRRNFIFTRVWLRTVLGGVLGRNPGAIDLETDVRGKPLLACGSLHVNWSHSHDACVLAFSRTARVGVDIEFHRDPWPIDVAMRYFHSDEVAQIKGQVPEYAQNTFFRLWSRKEAYYKCVGGKFMGGALSRDLRAHRVGDVWLWDFQGPFPGEAHSLGLAAAYG